MKFFKLLLLLPFFVFFCYAASETIIGYFEQSHAAKNYSSAKGKIVSSKLVKSRRRKKGPLHTPVIQYRYNVEGKDYTSKTYNHVRGFATRQEKRQHAAAQAVLKKYPIGSPVTVYYDPSDPNKAVISRENVSPRKAILIALPITLIWLALGYAVIKD